jgi:hypothetical protein
MIRPDSARDDAPRLSPPPPPAPVPARPDPAPLRAEPIGTETAEVRSAPTAVRVEPAVLNDEDDIRSTLTRFRTAYSQLDASAAQQVWPTVDVRALRSAFRSLKSQQLHFDRCSFSVNGASARAACSGRAIYVPGIGDQSPRTTAREWTFELKKADERWMISSARSS